MNKNINYDEYFNILNIEKTSDYDVIKRTYRKLSLKYHPDKNGDNCMFNKITEAYNILTSNIDNINNYIKDNDYSQTINDKSDKSDKSDTSEKSIIPHCYYSSNNNDIIQDIVLLFEQVYNGCCIPVTINRSININNIVTYETETIYTEIPKGTDNNEIIVIKNKGNVIDGIYSDIKINIKLQPHDIFTRNGLDIIYKKTITLKESLIGFSFNFTHINKKIYKINSNNIVKNNHTEIIKNLGFNRNNYTGSLYIIYNIEYPDKIEPDIINKLKAIL